MRSPPSRTVQQIIGCLAVAYAWSFLVALPVTLLMGNRLNYAAVFGPKVGRVFEDLQQISTYTGIVALLIGSWLGFSAIRYLQGRPRAEGRFEAALFALAGYEMLLALSTAGWAFVLGRYEGAGLLLALAFIGVYVIHGAVAGGVALYLRSRRPSSSNVSTSCTPMSLTPPARQ